MSALVVACRAGDLATAKAVVAGADPPLDVNKREFRVGTPLHAASKAGHVHVVRWLVRDLCANTEVETNQGTTALLAASQHGQVGTVGSLAALGANLEHRDRDKHTALFHACGFGRADVVRLLLALGVDADTPNSSGITPARVACREGHCGAVLALVHHDSS